LHAYCFSQVTDKPLIRQLKAAVTRKEPWAATFLRRDSR
jgi:hypothetical protein